MNNDNLGNRMKDYENVQRLYLTKRTPAIIRLDGKAFHSFTRKLQKPFDKTFMETMRNTAIYLCENIMGCKTAYVQSDEISLLLTDYENLTAQAWFDKNIVKMISVSASMATATFNKYWDLAVSDADRCLCYCKPGYENEYEGRGLFYSEAWEENSMDWIKEWNFPEDITKEKAIEYWENVCFKRFQAMFDSRVFNLPKEEVCNYFIWRQQDATRNAIQMFGRSKFSHKQLENKKCNQIQEMLWQEKQINFNDLPVCQKRGVCITKEYFSKNGTTRSRWIIDKNIPIFTQDRNYIEQYI
jgi:tRNA(His) 5'-end guanylyltransferase